VAEQSAESFDGVYELRGPHQLLMFRQGDMLKLRHGYGQVVLEWALADAAVAVGTGGAGDPLNRV
jgi:hypothetical protein